MSLRTPLPAIGIMMMLGLPPGAPRARADEPPQLAFEENVAPLLAKYCSKCHSGAKPKGGLDLTAIIKDAEAKDRATWEQIFERLEAGDMPPSNRPQPEHGDVERVMGWIKSRLSKAGCNGLGDPGHVTLRRLNRVEYNNTIRDLVGIDFQPADDFPSDDVGYGFDNIGDVLTLPPILMEKYLAAAEQVAERAIVVPDRAETKVKIWQAADLGDDAGGVPSGESGRTLTSEGEIAVKLALPEDGTYAVRVRAYGEQAGPDPVRMALKLDGESLKIVDVRATEGDAGLYEAEVKARAGDRRVAVAFLNDYYKPEAAPGERDRNLVVESIEVCRRADASARPLPESHRRILFRTPTAGADKDARRECAREVLKKFADRAYRRNAGVEDVDRLMLLVDMADQDGEPFERCIQLAVEAVLVSPHFVFKVEFNRRPGGKGKSLVRPVDNFALATRLSYFLWSTMPDEVLFDLARKRELVKEEVLEAQVGRMLKDPRARALVENFAGQWLQIRNLKTASPDPGHFPEFDEGLRSAMARETELFFEAIMTEDRSVLDFLDADFTFLNERLARHYGIPGVEGDQFRRVALTADGPRGGVLTQASILTVTSNPTRTSPVKRGKWILEQILGTPPPPPPPDVPELKDGKDAQLTGTLRQRMEQHRSNTLCASCHARMDPLGFGFENFDAVGAWRDKDGAFSIDPSGILPSGQSFQGPKELKAVLKGKSKEFTRCLAEKMLTYALGRGLDFNDRCAVDALVEGLAADGYRFSRLVIGVVKSDPFRFSKSEEANK